MLNGCADRPMTSEELMMLVSLTECVVSDVAKITGVDLNRDRELIRKRVASEGFPFLSKTLPNLAKALEQSLERGLLSSPSDFRKRKEGKTVTALPAFLQGLHNKVFEKSGKIRTNADPVSVWGIRQICYLTYKYKLPSTEEQNSEACRKVILTDASLPETMPQFGQSTRKGLLLQKARWLCVELFSSFDVRDIIPRNGAGACNSPLIHRQSDKYEFIRALPDDTEKCYPLDSYFSPSLACRRSGVAGSRYLPLAGLPQSVVPVSTRRDRDCDRHTVIVCVHKDSRGPRVIGKENPELQALQQGLRIAVQDWVEKHPLTRGHVNFKDQSINAQLALVSSQDRYLATLDMKDASDRVSVALVQALFPADVFEVLMATRSTHARFPDGSVVKLKKLSPMGSGVCFPVESIVFWALSVAALMTIGWSKEAALQNVYVYGDDTLVPSHTARAVMKLLEACSLRYNKSKCFIDGEFRESCGTDAFKGEIVTPLRVKTRAPTQITDAPEIVAWVSMANSFAAKGMWSTYFFIKNHVESIPKLGRLPSVPENASILGWHFETCAPDARWKPEPRSKKQVLAYAASASGCVNKTHARWIEVDDMAKPFYQGMTILGWKPVYETYDGPSWGLSELGRYFRFVSERTENSNIFGERYALSLKRQRYTCTEARVSLVAPTLLPMIAKVRHETKDRQANSLCAITVAKSIRRKYLRLRRLAQARRLA